MANERKEQTQIPERRLVMPELGSRYQPRRARRMFADIAPAPRAKGDVAPAPSVSAVAAPAARPAAMQPTGVVVPAKLRNDIIRQPQAAPARTTAKTAPALPRQHKSLVLKRQINVKAEQHQKQVKKERRQQVKAFLFGSVVAAVVAGIGVGFVFVSRANQAADNGQEQVAATLGATSGGPSETPVTVEAIAGYTAQPTQPRVLRIMRLGIQARIMPVGLSASGEPRNTTNIYDVGWLESSGKPGVGTMVLNGFTAGPTKPGVLAPMSSLIVGDIIEVEKGDGTKLTYKVVKAKSYPSDRVDMTEVKAGAAEPTPGLNILANVGRFNVRNNQFEARTAIWAVQL